MEDGTAIRALRRRRLASISLCRQALEAAGGDLARAHRLLDVLLVQEVSGRARVGSPEARAALEATRWDVEQACDRIARPGRPLPTPWEEATREGLADLRLESAASAAAVLAEGRPEHDALCVVAEVAAQLGVSGLGSILENQGAAEARELADALEALGASHHAGIVRECLAAAGPERDAPADPSPMPEAVVQEWRRRVEATGDELARWQLERLDDPPSRPGPWPPRAARERITELARRFAELEDVAEVVLRHVRTHPERFGGPAGS